MYDLDNLATDKKKGYIRALSHADINILMTDLIDEDKFFAHSNKYGSHLDMIAKTVMHSETGYSIIDPDGNFCSAFGVIPLEKSFGVGIQFIYKFTVYYWGIKYYCRKGDAL